MTHRRHHQTHHRGGIGVALAKLAITLIGGIAQNKMAEKARREQNKQPQKRR